MYGTDDEKVDAVHLSPATPLGEDVLEEALDGELGSEGSSRAKTALVNSLMVLLVVVSGISGWYISSGDRTSRDDEVPERLEWDPLAQTFGWLCAVLYLGSRVPQILLNYERKSCDGVSFMFFLFACLGNLTYVVSVLCGGSGAHYLWINASWLAGSVGTLFLDFAIFVQFFMYADPTQDYESIPDDDD